MLNLRWMVKLEYRKYGIVSNWWEYNMLWLESAAIFAYIIYQKPNISRMHVY